MAKYQYSDDELGGIIQNELERAYGRDTDHLQSHIKESLDYYYNRRRGDEKAGESQVQSSDLADMTNAVLAQMTPMLSSDALVTFEALGEDDEDQARMETRAVSDVVMDKNLGYTQLQSCLKDACLKRNTYAKVWVEDEEMVEIRDYRMPEDEVNIALGLLNEVPGQEAEIIDQDKDEGRTRIRVARRKRAFKWRSVDPANFYFQAGWEKTDLEGIRFCAERDEPTRSDLLADGIEKKIVDELPTVTRDTRMASNAQRATSQKPIETAWTKDQERIERHDCYLLVDMDGDGISELWNIVVAEKKHVIHKEQVQWHPFVAGTMFVRPHQLEGEDLFDRLKQVQDIKTGTLRRMMDGFYNSVWPRNVAQEGRVDEGIDDLRSGATIWAKGDVRAAVMPITGVDIGASCIQMLEYQDKVRTERGGAALDMQSTNDQLVGETYQGIEKQYSVKEALTQMMARNQGESLIRGVFLKMHRNLRSFAEGKMLVRYQDEFVQVDPSGWPARSSVNVIPGLTPAARQSIEMAMRMLVDLQGRIIDEGYENVLVTLDNVYRAIGDYLRSKGVQNVEQYLKDPSSTSAQQALQARAEAQMQQAQQQQALMDKALEIEALKVKQKQLEAQLQANVDIYEANLQAEAKEAELVEAARARRQAEIAAEAGGALGGGAAEAGGV